MFPFNDPLVIEVKKLISSLTYINKILALVILVPLFIYGHHVGPRIPVIGVLYVLGVDGSLDYGQWLFRASAVEDEVGLVLFSVSSRRLPFDKMLIIANLAKWLLDG